MDDAQYGSRNKRGDWKPARLIAYPQVFVWPVQPIGIMKWLFGYPGYLLPWNLLYAGVALACWFYATPPLEAMKQLTAGWIGFLLARNLVLVLLVFGTLHVRLYVQKGQGNAFKYNAKWLDADNSAFLFRNQTIDNMVRSLGSGVVLWTAYEALTLWALANGWIPFVSWAAHPIYCVLLMLLIPLMRDAHFYVVHRLLHWPPLYRAVHKVHHNNVNPGPWSGLAMHSIEHVLYFSGVLLHWIVPSHPVHALFHLIHAGLTPAAGHAGFDKLVIGKSAAVDTDSYDHYLHHKYFECNYGDGTIPIDKWMGTFHDGSKEAHEAMNKRFMARARSKVP